MPWYNQYGKRTRPLMIFKKKVKPEPYDRDKLKPVIRSSICTGEQVAGFLDVHTGAFEDVMLIRNDTDLKKFMDRYGIEHSPEKIY